MFVRPGCPLAGSGRNFPPMPTEPATARPPQETTSRRIAPTVALTLLEVIRRRDSPTEVLEAEDPSITMPRRLGLSEVIERQIRRYREEVRRKERISDSEFRDLVRLVTRRPDSVDVFFQSGNILSGEGWFPQWQRGLPRPLGYGLMRRRTRRGLARLFGRRIGGFGPGPFVLEACAHLLIDSDPGGDACHLLTGFAQTAVQQYCGRSAQIAHTLCEGRGDPFCRWTILAEDRAQEESRGLALNPGAG